MSPSFNSTEEERDDRLAPLGRALLVAGIVLVVVRGLTLTTRMSGLPAFWYANQPTWVGVGLGLAGLGWWILWQLPRVTVQNWRPSIPGRRFDTAVLYVGEECHLCHDAADLLARYGKWLPPIQEINIKTDPTLSERYCTCVPVLVLDGKVRFRGKFNEVLLRRLIEGTPPVKMF